MSASIDSINTPPKSAAAVTEYTYRISMLDTGAGHAVHYGPHVTPNAEQGKSPAPNRPICGDTVVYYINGMMTTPESHESAANHLAGILGLPVLGIYNQTGISDGSLDGTLDKVVSGATDFAQCLVQWATPVGRSLPAVAQLLRRHLAGRAVVELLSSSWPYLSQEARTDLLRRALFANRVSQVFLGRLVHDIRTAQRIVIVAHSQGNLSAGNSLWALTHVLADEEAALAKITMIGLASPNPSWPNHGLTLKLFRDQDDLVPVVSGTFLGRQPENIKDKAEIRSFGISKFHDVGRYMSYTGFQRYVRSAAGLGDG